MNKSETQKHLEKRLIASGQTLPTGADPLNVWIREGLLKGWLPLPYLVIERLEAFLEKWMDDEETWLEAADRLIALHAHEIDHE